MSKQKAADTSTYDPRFIEIWNSAATTDVEIPVDDEKEGIALRHRLYRLRMAMHREMHPSYPNASKCSIPNPYKRDGQWYIKVKNSDKKYDAALAKAGFDVPPAPPLLD